MMPVQRTMFGRTVTVPMLNYRYRLVLTLILLFILARIYFRPLADVEVPVVSKIEDRIHDSIRKHNPFGPSAHKPLPEQANSTSGDTRWFADWKWKNPFSSSITFDENRAVLPPLDKRPPIYTYYEPSSKDKNIREAENQLVMTWRRAWWAQGFRPLVLGRAEAVRNPLYEAIQKLKLDATVESELARWLAWGHIGTGIMSNWLALPMAPYHDPLLSYLRHGEYPQLTRFNSLQDSIYTGEKGAINSAVQKLLKKSDVKDVKNVGDIFDDETFEVYKNGEGVAFYDSNMIKSKYKAVHEKLKKDTMAEGLTLLRILINAHLHSNWQETFSSGIVVLRPHPKHTSILSEPAVDIARNLTQCPANPVPSSCPPNRPRCHPCVATQPKPLQYLPHYRNESKLYTIASVPHPFTFTSLRFQLKRLTPRFLRRDQATARDTWISLITQELLGTGHASGPQLIRFKEAVAGPNNAAHSLWLIAERDEPEPSTEDLDWLFGFALPRERLDPGHSETPVPGPERRPAPPKSDLDPPPTKDELATEADFLANARRIVMHAKEPTDVIPLRAVESWNLADTEAWRFARAFNARRRQERKVWEAEESAFAGSLTAADGDHAHNSRSGARWTRWADWT